MDTLTITLLRKITSLLLGGDIITAYPGVKYRAKIRRKDIGGADGWASPWLAGAVE